MIVPALVLVVVTVVTKLVVGHLTARDYDVMAQRRAGALLSARGEFSVVIAGIAVAAGGTGCAGRAGRDLRDDHRDRGADPRPRGGPSEAGALAGRRCLTRRAPDRYG